MTANKTWVYTYDIRGNILSRKTYAYTTGTLGTVQDTDTYEYYDQSSSTMWGDALLRYDGTNFISYDAIGNPTGYYNSMSDIYTFSWQNGRQLASGTKGTTEFAYTYNADGLRTKKVVNGVTTEYYWAGSQLAMMIVNPDLSTKKVLKFYYDAEGIPMCLDYNGTVYYYITNLQGDVVALADQYGEVIRYEYDAWGKPISTYYVATPYHDAMYYNPLRYRGYIYDNETGFYYLQSRYYDPVVSRFINSDGQLNEGFLGNNMFAYCENNPISYYDPDGEFAISAMLIGIAVGMVIGFTVTACVDYSDDGKVFNGSVSAEGYIVNIVVGGLVGGFTGGVGSSTFTVSLPTLQVLQTTIGTLEIVMGTTTVGVSGLVVAGAGVVGVAAAGSLMYHKPDSGSIRFNDGTGIDPDTGKPVDNKERAIEIYRSLKDTKQKLNWKAWMKGKGWRSCHLK